MKTTKACLLLSSIFVMAGCGSTLTDKLINGGTITASDFKNAYDTYQNNSKLEADSKQLSKGLIPSSTINLASRQSLFDAYERAEIQMDNNPKVKACRAYKQEYLTARENFETYYRDHKTKIDAVLEKRAFHNVAMGLGVLFCAADQSEGGCGELLTNNAVDVANGKGGIKSAVQEINSAMDKQFLDEENAHQEMRQYDHLAKVGLAVQDKVKECLPFMSNQETQVNRKLVEILKDCEGNNWFGLQHEQVRKQACTDFVTNKTYKKFL